MVLSIYLRYPHAYFPQNHHAQNIYLNKMLHIYNIATKGVNPKKQHIDEASAGNAPLTIVLCFISYLDTMDFPGWAQ